ncbi:hypothetical protein ILYODFUR_038130 [Ilyodon furcidens]|uniref:Uncharacterized protein n=1 Tax=Ilyodon furcidens TaxID=33524 RepID=A0ABV0TRG5_9TELE
MHLHQPPKNKALPLKCTPTKRRSTLSKPKNTCPTPIHQPEVAPRENPHRSPQNPLNGLCYHAMEVHEVGRIRQSAARSYLQGNDFENIFEWVKIISFFSTLL